MKKTLHIKITGKVQMVGFRYPTIQMAEKLNLTGWVRNLENGGVEVLANGNESDLKKLLDWCYTGPPNAEVKNVEFEWRESQNEFDRFKIKY